MRTTIKRIDVGSAFRVGLILYALLFAIFGLLFVAFQGLLLSGLESLMRASIEDGSSLPVDAPIVTFGLLSLLCFYGVGVVIAAIFGGIQFAVGAFCYNITSGWVGGIKVELETEETDLLDDIERDTYKRKRDEL
jgi:hypothetical protein